MQRVAVWLQPGAQPSLPFSCSTVEASDRPIPSLLEASQAPVVVLVWHRAVEEVTPWALPRCLVALESCPMVYGDYEAPGGIVHTLDPEPGALRDEFDSGPVWVTRGAHLRALCEGIDPSCETRGVRYRLWLGFLRRGTLRLREVLCKTRQMPDEDIFSYVRSDEQAVQRDLERALTSHLKEVGAWLPPRTQPFADRDAYPVEASVVIPVKDRRATVMEAVESALNQETTFPFNVIVVDNHSRDGTTDLLRRVRDPRLHHLVPSRSDLGIGGCWNEAAMFPGAGRYLVQLDSDDLFSCPGALQTMVDLISSGPWGMAVGSYRTVDFHRRELPPGLVDHREWTDENGHNNLLRVSGVGAPRAFSTALVRQVWFPNVSYGEDYAMALRISRTYRVARTFQPLCLVRRWEGNTDAKPSPQVRRSREAFKNRLRTMEVLARTRGAS